MEHPKKSPRSYKGLKQKQKAKISDGRITEIGTHQELLKKGGVYADLYRTQNALALEGL